MGAKPGQSTIKATTPETCDVISNPCGAQGTCVSLPNMGHRCDCRPDYELSGDGVCVVDNDTALKVALPIVLVLLLAVFLFVLLWALKRNRENNPKSYHKADTLEEGKRREFDNKAYDPEG